MDERWDGWMDKIGGWVGEEEELPDCALHHIHARDVLNREEATAGGWDIGEPGEDLGKVGGWVGGWVDGWRRWVGGRGGWVGGWEDVPRRCPPGGSRQECGRHR